MGDQMDLVWNVPYTPGVLKATGRDGGKVVYEQEIYTSGKPAKIELLADRDVIQADGQDVVHLEVNVLDNKGHFVPDALNDIEFSVEGEGVVIAVDNGDPMSLEPFLGDSRKAFNGKCLLIVKSTKESGNITISASSKGLEGAELTIGSE